MALSKICNMIREGRPRDWDEAPWRDSDTMHQLYHEEGLSQREIAERFDVAGATIQTWMNRLGIRARDPQEYLSEETWRDPDYLREEYVEKGRSVADIAAECDVSTTTIYRWMDEFGIETRGLRVERASFYTDQRGYERWGVYDCGEVEIVSVHRLLAVAEYGFEAVKGMDVHHGPAEIPWANWHANVRPVDPSEHRRMHQQTKA